MLGWNERAWRIDLPGTCGLEICPTVCPQWAIESRGKTCLNWVKMPNGEFDFYFCTIYRNDLKSGFLNL